MTIPIYGAGELRQAVHFTDLVEPLRVAFGEFSSGRAQQVMSAIWPARRRPGLLPGDSEPHSGRVADAESKRPA